MPLPQVVVGAILGFAFGAIWFWIAQACIFPLSRAIVASSVGRKLLLRDPTEISDVIIFEHALYRDFYQQKSK